MHYIAVGVDIMSSKDIILHQLQKGGQSASGLARLLDVPVPSVRRLIQALRREGHNISFADVQEQIYRLGQ